jgi:hypothetical protein
MSRIEKLRRMRLGTGELFGMDVSRLKPGELTAWMIQNPFEVGRIIGYHDAHYGQLRQSSDAATEPFATFSASATEAFDKHYTAGAVYRQGLELGRLVTTIDVGLERALRTIKKAYTEANPDTGASSEAEIVR